MMRRITLIICLFLLAGGSVSAQAPMERYITFNTNLFVPIGSDKSMYPIIGYNKEVDPKLLVGGFGAGFAISKSLKEDLKWKAQANLSRHTYWDESLELRDAGNVPLGPFAYSSVDYCATLMGTAELSLNKRFSVGAGLGAKILLVSFSRLPDRKNSSFNGKKSLAENAMYKTIIPVIPLELSYKMKRNQIVLRYEQGLMNRYKRDLAEYKKDRFGIISFEYGWRIK